MFDFDIYEVIAPMVGQALGEAHVVQYAMLDGGSTSTTVRVQCETGSEKRWLVVKYMPIPVPDESAGDNPTLFPDPLAAEARGLQLLADTHTVATPAIIGQGQWREYLYLITGYEHSLVRQADYWTRLGRQLADLHRVTAPQAGLDHHNYIGRLPQRNPWTDDPIAFFGEHRILAQAGRALYEERIDGKTYDQLKALVLRLPELLPAQPASLLHGDLWSGNVLVGTNGHPVVIDPAVYYGLREAELAFTYMFGGFEAPFYHAYEEAHPLEPGFLSRREIYNLYPLLVHLNLFGAGYLNAILRTVERFR